MSTTSRHSPEDDYDLSGSSLDTTHVEDEAPTVTNSPSSLDAPLPPQLSRAGFKRTKPHKPTADWRKHSRTRQSITSVLEEQAAAKGDEALAKFQEEQQREGRRVQFNLRLSDDDVKVIQRGRKALGNINVATFIRLAVREMEARIRGQ